MVSFLARLLIKEHDNYTSPTVRIAYGMLTGIVGITLNVLLFFGKFIAGALANSVSVMADAFNNLSDAGSSLMSLIGFRLSGQKPDPKHPFGHGRIEYIAGLIVSLLIILMGVDLMQSGIDAIGNPEPVEFSWLTVGILGASILVKFYMFLYNRGVGKKIASQTLQATASDSFSDMASTAAVLLSTLLSHYFGWRLDGIAGVLVAGFILYTGIKSAKETVDPLLGLPPEKEYVKRIEGIVRSHPEVTGIHDMLVHNYGPGREVVSLHAEVSADGDILKLHDVIDNIEKELHDALNCRATIHMDPICTDDAETNRLCAVAAELVRGIDPNMTIHDFRIVAGPTHTNLLFDVVVPLSCKLTDDAVRERVEKDIGGIEGHYFAVIAIDHSIL